MFFHFTKCTLGQVVTSQPRPSSVRTEMKPTAVYRALTVWSLEDRDEAHHCVRCLHCVITSAMAGFLHTELKTTNYTSKLSPLADPSSVFHTLLFGKEAAAQLCCSGSILTGTAALFTHHKAVDLLDPGCWLNWLGHGISVGTVLTDV